MCVFIDAFPNTTSRFGMFVRKVVCVEKIIQQVKYKRKLEETLSRKAEKRK